MLFRSCYFPVFARQDRVYPFLDAVYSSIKLYSGSTESGIPVGGLLQIARFLALAATLNLLINGLNKMTDIINRVKLLDFNTTVVYGDSVYAGYLFENLELKQRIRGEEKFIDSAERYVLMFSSDARNLAFYNRNYESLKSKNVYIMLENIARQNIEKIGSASCRERVSASV